MFGLFFHRHRDRCYCWRSVHSVLGVYNFSNSLFSQPILSFKLGFVDKFVKVLKLSDFLCLHQYHKGIASFKFIEHRQHFSPLENIGIRKHIVVVFVCVGEINSPRVN